MSRLRVSALERVIGTKDWGEVQQVKGYIEALEDILSFDEDLEERLMEAQENGDADRG